MPRPEGKTGVRGIGFKSLFEPSGHTKPPELSSLVECLGPGPLASLTVSSCSGTQRYRASEVVMALYWCPRPPNQRCCMQLPRKRLAYARTLDGLRLRRSVTLGYAASQ